MGRLSEILLECLQMSKNSSFYKRFGRNRPIALMNGCDETVHHEPLPLSPDRSIANGRPDEAWIVCVIKRIKRRPLDRDPTVQMSNARFNQDRYNPSLNCTCLRSRLVVRAPRD